MESELEYVYTVYQEKSFSKAAQKLFVSQSAVSAMVRKAEEKIGCQIFDRSTIPFSVTQEGQYFIGSIEKIRAIERSTAAFFNDVKQLKTGRLSVGSSSFYCAYYLSQQVKHFKKKYPGIHIDIREGNAQELKHWLMDETLDLLLETVLADNEGVQRLLFDYEYLVLGVPSEWAINERLGRYQISVDAVRNNLFLRDDVPAIPLWELKEYPLVNLKEGNDMYRRSLDICHNAGFTPKLSLLSLDQIITAYYVASSGAGFVFLRSSLLNVVGDTKGLTYYKVGDELARRPIYLSYKKGRYVTRTMRSFLELAGTALPASDDVKL